MITLSAARCQRLFVIALLLLTLPGLATPPTATPTRVQARQSARNFSTVDTNGQPVSLASLKGHRVLLLFMRNVGCPVCNRRMYELLEQANYFQAHNLTVVAVYESTPEHLREYLTGQPMPFVMVPNPDQSLYQLYGLEISASKVLNSLFHGGLSKAREGKKLFTQPMKQDGNKNRIGAEFLIDEQGTVAVAHYGRYIGDELPLASIKNFLR
ncbi:peroxiredoxin-like family protein [Hymenobacter terrenus]|uniref:peroxiredoxin-like family protein n=1 Tax=Hymenobacter terrenus TaxID=1629124 RepID=UPI000619355D|nr:peroxiredoxin-like family protein [Hymenobacter terrenus]